MSLVRYFPFSLTIHLLVIFFIGLNLQKTKLNEFFVPQKWVLDVNVILQERDLELPVPGNINAVQQALEQDVKHADDTVPAKEETTPSQVNPDIPDRDAATPPLQQDEQAQIHARQMQDAYIARMNFQFLIYHTKAFYKNARLAAQAFINTEMNEVKRDDLNGASAVIKMAYSDDGTIKNIEINSESDKFAEILKKVNWKAVPRPYSFMLPYKDINLNIAVKNGMPVVGIEVL